MPCDGRNLLLIEFRLLKIKSMRDQDDFDNAIKEIKEQSKGKVYGLTADVTEKQDIERIWNEIDKTLGGIDILINNAALPAKGVIDEEYENIKYILETNILGYINFTKQAVSKMQSQQSSHIINIGSMSADTQEATGTVYVASKSAIRGFSAALRKEINAKGIKVSLIEPGLTKSDIHSMSKEEQREKIKRMEMLEASDVAITILFCLSQANRCDIVSLQVKPHLQII